MLPDTLIKIFKVPDVRKASHMMTDVPFWTKQFALLANANYEHTRGIQKVINNQTVYLDNLKEKGLQGKDEKKFYKEVSFLNKIYTQQVEKLKTDANEYVELEKALRSFEDESNKAVGKLDNKYRLAWIKLDNQTKNVETQKKLYHKMAFSVEKTEIKAKMAYQPDVIFETKKKLDELQVKASAQVDKYNKQLEKWEAKFAELQKISADFEESYRSREEDRAQVVLNSLQNSVEFTMAGNYAQRETGFTHINKKRFVTEKLVQNEAVQVPSFQVYTGETGKDEMYEMARAEIETNDDDTAQQGSDPDDELDGLAKTCAANKKLSEHNKNTIYVVIKAYEKQGINQLKLKIGEHVKQMLPANEYGLAYGQVVHGFFHKKKKGFYPASHVVQLQNEAEKHQTQTAQNANQSDVIHMVQSLKRQKGIVSDVINYNEANPVGGCIDTSAEEFQIRAKESEVARANKQAWGVVADQNGDIGANGEKKVESDARRRRRESKKKAKEQIVE